MALRPILLLLVTCLALAPAPAQAQDPLQALPRNYWKIFENSEVTVIRAHYGAHESIPVHDHPGISTVFVYLNDSSPVRIDHIDDGKTESVVRPPTAKGAFRVIQGVPERHTIQNLGDKPSDFLRVELKHVQVATRDGFRGPAPATLNQPLDAEVFNEPALTIERIVCVQPAAVCNVKPAGSRSLLIALADLQVARAVGHEPETLPLGAVRWLEASQSLSLIPHTGSTGHLLRILLPAAPSH
ncbi:MAG: hypothetical protein M3O02_10240 [Acidobacteriota bacterium]|nr:hypothetical protein [Acidobacteriota bacterium]